MTLDQLFGIFDWLVCDYCYYCGSNGIREFITIQSMLKKYQQLIKNYIAGIPFLETKISDSEALQLISDSKLYSDVPKALNELKEEFIQVAIVRYILSDFSESEIEEVYERNITKYRFYGETGTDLEKDLVKKIFAIEDDWFY